MLFPNVYPDNKKIALIMPIINYIIRMLLARGSRAVQALFNNCRYGFF
jgi:hypothetical protein